MDEFNNYPWGSISFEFLQDSLLFAPGKKESDEENDGKGKGQKKGKKAVRNSVRKGKKNVEDEKPKRINRPGCSIKGLSYAPVILRLLQPSQLEMSQPYWSWGSDVPECDAPSVGPRLRNEVAILHREKGKLEERVLCLEKCTSHADARKTGDARAERNKTKDAGEERNKTEDAGEESQKTVDAGDESDKTEDGGVAESREQCVQNGKEEVQYTPLDINWDDPGVGECGEDVIVGVRQKRGRGKSEILGPAMKRLRNSAENGDKKKNMALLLLRERHERSGNWVGSDWMILDTTFQVSVMMHNSCATMGNEDRQHSKGLLEMVKRPKLAKSWSSVNRNSSHPTGCAVGGENAAPVVKGIWIHWRRGDCGMYILKYYEFLTSNVDLAKISHDAMLFYQLKLAV
ncbi:unnamed protein product [Prunus armeniaca]|uniref:Uncharacterized protein n=1 Tax=Prunus armeniaca TaxID=36596 RepID=A0A6J5XZF2_PRUAR|nr:unnamed protein product [Prunus armeniaca]